MIVRRIDNHFNVMVNINSSVWVCTVFLILLLALNNLVAQEKTRKEILIQKRMEKAKKLQPYQPGIMEKLFLLAEHNMFQEEIRNGFYGFFPIIGKLKSGAGTGAGIKFNPTNRFEHFFFSLQASLSIRAYQDYLGRIGYEKGKWSIFGFSQFRDSPQESFFGTGLISSKIDRTTYRLKDIKLSGVFSLRPASTIRTFFQASYLKNEITSGVGRKYPSIEEKFTAKNTPGLAENTEFYIGSFNLVLDFRGQTYIKKAALQNALSDNPLNFRSLNPYKGTLISVKASRYESKSDKKYDFNRFDFEFQHYFPFVNGHRVIAFRNFISLTDRESNADIPFYLMQPLGGAMSLRGFKEFRFRDRNSLLLNLEYRWYAWSGLDMALFLDAGKVFPQAKKMNFTNLKISYGIGFHFNSKTSLPLRFDIAHSVEGFHFVLKFSNIF